MSRKRSEATADDVPSKKRRNAESSDQVDQGDADDTDYPEGVSQKFIQEITKLLENHVRSGKIQKMILKNFMCHSNMLVDFNKRVNLLVGNNGSGKSAVLTALIVGLGSSASVTNRSNSLKHLIKNGENSSTIEIHISNDGFDAYDQAIFGKKIIVTRTLMASGSSLYKLKDEKGHVVSSNKADLSKMTLCLNIQAENPVCVLNQDQARSFLKESDPAKRYKLFLKATQIDVIIDKLNDCAQHYTSARNQMEYQRKSIGLMEKELAETQDKYSKLQSVETLKTELEGFKNDLNWSLVKHCESEMDELKQSLSTTAKLLSELMGEIKSRDGTKEKLAEKLVEIDAEITTMRSTVDAETENYEKVRQELVKITEEKGIQARNVKKAEIKKQRTLADIQQIESTLAERNDSYTNNILRQKQENERKIKELADKRDEIESMVNNVQRDVDMYNNTINQEQDVVETNTSRKNGIIAKMRHLKSQISQIDGKAADSLAVYGRDMPRLVARIKQLTDQGKFSKLPRGPLGHYIQVPDRKWRPVVEQTIGNHVRTFCVNSDGDRLQLDNLFRMEFPQLKSTIITGKFADKVYDVSHGRVQAVQNTQTMMSVLKVTDAVVMNCLIDQVRIESILLVEDQALATHITADEENIPHNLSKVILLQPLSEIFPAPAYRSYALPDRQVRFIQVNTAEQKRQYSQELQENGQKMGAVEEELKESNAKITNLRKSLAQRQQQLKSMDAEKRQLIGKINELKAIEYPSEQDNELLQTELEELKNSIEEIETALAAENVKLVALEEREREKEAKLKVCKTKKRQIDGEIQKLQDNRDAERAKLSNLDNNKKYNQNLLKSYGDEMVTKKGEFEKKKKEHATISQQAAQFGARTESEHTSVELNRIIKTMEKRIRTICSSKENITDVKSVLDVQQEKLNFSLSVIDVLSRTLKTLQKARTERFKFISRMKDHMSLRVKQKFHLLDSKKNRFENIYEYKQHMSRRICHKFAHLMQLRKFNGQILLDHKEKTLELEVIPRNGDHYNTVCNTQSLSGGERSYSTVAFLIAMWTALDHPFFFLDEYDVFTDQVNRHVMTKLLLHEAENRPNRQYVFLTPQDMSAIDANEMITIHKMEDPRLQTAE